MYIAQPKSPSDSASVPDIADTRSCCTAHCLLLVDGQRGTDRFHFEKIGVDITDLRSAAVGRSGVLQHRVGVVARYHLLQVVGTESTEVERTCSRSLAVKASRCCSSTLAYMLVSWV